MNEAISNLIATTDLSDTVKYRNLSIHRLMDPRIAGPDYLTLRMALKLELLEVTEISDGGSVPELRVHNKADKPVIILDGEEVIGAKQNRVLNTTVMVAPGAHIKIPVSCVERGRWRRESTNFSDSDQVMPSMARSGKMCQVNDSLGTLGLFKSDQRRVWSDVAEISLELDVRSPTGSMSDVFSSRKDGLNDYLSAISRVDGQCGLLALIDGKVAGLDLLSRPTAYAGLHDKLVRSYAIDALRMQQRRDRKKQNALGDEDSQQPELPGLDPEPSAEVDTRAAAITFLHAAVHCDEEIHASVGMGEDHRLSAETVVGSALIVDQTPIHLALFPKSERKRKTAPDRPNPFDGICGYDNCL